MIMKFQTVIRFLVCGVFFGQLIESSKILVIYPIPFRSITYLGEGLVKILLQAGHEVTFATAFPEAKIQSRNYSVIDISGNIKTFTDENKRNVSFYMYNRHKVNADIASFQSAAVLAIDLLLNNVNFKNLLLDETKQFDLVIADFIETEFYNAIAAFYGCPLIWNYSLGPHWIALRLVGETANPAYTVTYTSSNVPPLSFNQRVEELWAQAKWRFWKWWTTIDQERRLYNQVLVPIAESRGKRMPTYDDILFNASLVFCNSHYAFGNVPSLPQNVKLVGGYHLSTHKEDISPHLRTILDNAQNGFMYFSMGSVWKSQDIPKHITEGLLRLFGKLKYKVIWKYEGELQNVPKNVHLIKWAPQPKVLSHSNCRLFITHGGLLSITEALYNGLPLITIPIFYDQLLNAARSVASGFAVKVELDHNLLTNLEKAIEEVLENPNYASTAREKSAIFRDRALPPERELVYWSEHVIRTRGAPHLRSAATTVAWYQLMYLDLAAVVACLLATVYVVGQRIYYIKSNAKKKLE